MITHKFLLLIIIAFLFSVSALFGKNRITEGYIITLQGDSIHGEIKDLGLNRNTKQCFFRKKDTEEFIEYKPGEIHSFRTRDKYCITKEVTFEGNTDTIFVEFLVDGVIDLYYLQYNNMLYYLIEDDNGEQTLMNVNSKTPESNEDVVSDRAQHSRKIGTLKAIMKDYPPIFPEVEGVYIEDNRSMKKLMVSYHNGVCSEYDCIDYTKRTTKAKMFLGISFGLKMPALNFDGDEYSEFRYVEGADLKTALSAYYSIDFSSTIPTNERFGVHAKLEFSKEKYEYTYSGSYDALTSISHNYAALYLNFNYVIGSGDITFLPYVGIGFTMYYNQDCSITPNLPPGYRFEPIILNDIRMGYNTGICIDVPLIKDREVHLRASLDYRFSLRKPLKVGDNFTYYTYNAPGLSIMLLKYL